MLTSPWHLARLSSSPLQNLQLCHSESNSCDCSYIRWESHVKFLICIFSLKISLHPNWMPFHIPFHCNEFHSIRFYCVSSECYKSFAQIYITIYICVYLYICMSVYLALTVCVFSYVLIKQTAISTSYGFTSNAWFNDRLYHYILHIIYIYSQQLKSVDKLPRLSNVEEANISNCFYSKNK